MGGTGWAYQVPYQADIQAALDALRADVFARGAYERVWEQFPEFAEDLIAEVAEMGEMGEEVDPTSIERLRAGEPPASIDDALLWSTTEGTHSVLDVARVADEPDFGVLTPAPPALLAELFGTHRPAAADLWAGADNLLERVENRWQGYYAIGYDGDTPTIIVVVGASGD